MDSSLRLDNQKSSILTQSQSYITAIIDKTLINVCLGSKTLCNENENPPCNPMLFVFKTTRHMWCAHVMLHEV